ncbi:MAG: DUF4235 domain-containing protein [Sporichthyaceae bacterium]|nr:DUF4235 domain-containing protein [Sporichthyaceae bacterium]
MSKLLYKPFGTAVSIAGGLMAGALFKRIWHLVSDQDQPPKATEQDYGWGEVLAAAALQGAVFGLVKAAIDRAGATGFRRMTGTWPG